MKSVTSNSTAFNKRQQHSASDTTADTVKSLIQDLNGTRDAYIDLHSTCMKNVIKKAFKTIAKDTHNWCVLWTPKIRKEFKKAVGGWISSNMFEIFGEKNKNKEPPFGNKKISIFTFTTWQRRVEGFGANTVPRYLLLDVSGLKSGSESFIAIDNHLKTKNKIALNFDNFGIFKLFGSIFNDPHVAQLAKSTGIKRSRSKDSAQETVDHFIRPMSKRQKVQQQEVQQVQQQPQQVQHQFLQQQQPQQVLQQGNFVFNPQISETEGFDEQILALFAEDVLTMPAIENAVSNTAENQYTQEFKHCVINGTLESIEMPLLMIDTWDRSYSVVDYFFD